MPVSAHKTLHLLSGHSLPRNVPNFTCSHIDLKKFPRETPRGGEWKGRGWIKMFLPLKERRGGKEEGRGNRGGKKGWGILLHDFKGG